MNLDRRRVVAPRATRSLAAVHPGEQAIVAGGAPIRLADLGFVAGTHVRVIRRAPLGDPVELELRGFRICLRRADLAGVLVEAEPEPGS